MGQKRKRPILLQFIVLMIIVAAVLWPAAVWLYIENVGFETIRTAYEITSGRLLWFWGRLKKFQTTFVDYQADYDSQRLLKFTLYAGF